MICLFVAGGYLWRISSAGSKGQSAVAGFFGRQSQSNVEVYVNDKPISEDELNFELRVHQKILKEVESDSPANNLEERSRAVVLEKLKDTLIATIVERRVLFADLQNNYKFDQEDKNRLSSCLKDFASAKESLGDSYSKKDLAFLKNRLCQTSLISQYADEFIFRGLSLKDDEIKEYFDKHLDEFKVGQRVVLRQIVLASEAEAKKLQWQITRANFERLAKEHSISPEGKNGGLLGPFTVEQIPQVFDLAFTMKVGSIYGILKSPYGFHIILLVNKLPKTVFNLKEARPKIVAKLLEEKRQEEFQKWVDSASKAAKIRISRAG